MAGFYIIATGSMISLAIIAFYLGKIYNRIDGFCSQMEKDYEKVGQSESFNLEGF